MHSLSFSGIVHHGGRSVAECRPVAREIGGVGGLLVYITLNSGRSACLLMGGTITVHSRVRYHLDH